jgi:glycosyltransferase involved in cell wall biosynthesis
MKIRVEVSSLASANLSGVAQYTKRLTEVLDSQPNTWVQASYFNFLNRQVTPNLTIKEPLDSNTLLPLRVYAKLQSYGIAPAFDSLKSKKVDLTIFPNFATWPTIHSRLRATVIHDLTYLYFPEVVEVKNLAHLRRVVPRSIKKADFIITVSEAVKAELIKEFQLSPDTCIVTPIPPEESFAHPNDNEVHKKYNIPTKKYIYFIGTLEPRKNLPTLISAYQLLPKKIRDEYSLVLAGGKGWKTEESQAAIDKAIEAGEKVIHIGYIDQADSSALFQKASAFVMPSIYEGFGMPILEALASHTPVVASDIPVLRETGEDAALYASPDKPSEFADQIEAILTSPTLVADLDKKASTRLRKISWQDNAVRIISHTKQLLEE